MSQPKNQTPAPAEALRDAANPQPQQTPDAKLAAEAAARGLTVKQYKSGYDMKSMG